MKYTYMKNRGIYKEIIIKLTLDFSLAHKITEHIRPMLFNFWKRYLTVDQITLFKVHVAYKFLIYLIFVTMLG